VSTCAKKHVTFSVASTTHHRYFILHIPIDYILWRIIIIIIYAAHLELKFSRAPVPDGLKVRLSSTLLSRALHRFNWIMGDLAYVF